MARPVHGDATRCYRKREVNHHRHVRVVISRRKQLTSLSPVGRLLTIFALSYDAAIRPAAAFDDNLGEVSKSARHFRTLMIDNAAMAPINMMTAVGSGTEVFARAPAPPAADDPSDGARPKFARQMS